MENKGTNEPNLPKENIVEKVKLEDARKKGLTKGAVTAGIIGLILLLVVAVWGYSHYNRQHNEQLALMEDQKLSFTEQLTARDSMINEWLATFDEIEQNLNAIKQKENILTVKAGESEFTKEKKDQVLEDIKYINTLLEENKKKIARLSAQLKESGNTITGLQTRIETLEASMKQFETEVSDLKATLVNKDFEIEQLNTRMFALQDTLTMKDEFIEGQTYQLNKGFLASGTYKDLKEKGLVSKEGGFLGLGRKETLLEVQNNLFSEIDITQTTTIPVNSRNAKLITEHPTDSYQMVRENENTIAYIEIKNPEEFWRVSKYAVVELIK